MAESSSKPQKLRIFCCLNRDLLSNFALNLLLPALTNHEVHVGLTERVGGTLLPPDAWGLRELQSAEQRLPNEVFFPMIERGALPDDGIRYLTFTEIERCRGIQVSVLSRPNTAEGLETIQAFAPDLILTIRYGAILKPPVIAIPRLGVLNLHSGILPAYRGVLATFRALADGRNEIGCTLHEITDGTIDTGGVISVAHVPASNKRSLLWHIMSLYPPGAALVTAALDRLARGLPLERTPQLGGGAYFSYPTVEDWAAFTRKGWRVVDAGDLDEAFRRYLPRP